MAESDFIEGAEKVSSAAWSNLANRARLYGHYMSELIAAKKRFDRYEKLLQAAVARVERERAAK